MRVALILAGCLLVFVSLGYTPDALKDQIFNLPGAEKLNVTFNQFSGYFNVQGTKNNHYWLVESMKNPATDPVVFWTNGGPGCSGLIGMWTEQGPFRANADLTLKFNEFNWNQIANMVFIEQPCGVGFSYSNKTSDYVTGDAQAAQDNYQTILEFQKRFPEYANNPLYITSESYGGHYMPTWAKEIVDQNAAGNNPKVNFKGFAVGNPYTNVFTGTQAGIITFWGHQVISKPVWTKYQELCLLPAARGEQQGLLCAIQEFEINTMIGKLMNPYALDYPICLTKSGKHRPRSSLQAYQLQQFLYKAAGLTADMQATLSAGLGVSDPYDPCVDNYAVAYLNRADVKAAIHVKPDLKWAECSNVVLYNQTDSSVGMEPYYKYLIDGGFGLNIMVYSGDDDAVCATVGTQEWIWDLGYAVKPGAKAWAPYFTADGQTAGFITEMQGLTFATVRGAGHEVPTYKPEAGFYLFSNYLNGTL